VHVAFHIALWAAALVVLGVAAYFSPIATALAVTGIAVGLYPTWEMERQRLAEAAEGKYRGHAIASERYATREVREMALEFANRGQAMAEALGDAHARLQATGAVLLDTVKEANALPPSVQVPSSRNARRTFDIDA